jgi:rod shape-determining protein MreD
MIASLAAFPILLALLIFQSAVVSRIPLLLGTPDLVFLAIIAWALQKRVRSTWQWAVIGGLLTGFMSALPYGSILIGYLISVGVASILRRRVWQMPILAMFATTFLGTLVCLSIDVLSLRITGVSLPMSVVFNQAILPSMLLNLILAAPFYILFGDLASWLYPVELEM